MSDENGAPEAPDTPKEETPGWKTCCLWPALAVLALGIGGAIVGALGASGEEDSGPSSEMASYHCREMVKEKLRDPSSAEFSDETVTGNGTYEIAGTVRAANGFGGTAVHEYECRAVFDPSDDGYSVTMRIY